MKRLLACAVVASTFCNAANAGGYVAPILDIPPPLPAPVAVSAPTSASPWLPYAAIGLLLIVLVASHDGDGDHHSHKPDKPAMPEDPQFPGKPTPGDPNPADPDPGNPHPGNPDPGNPGDPGNPHPGNPDEPQPAPVPLPGALGLLLGSLGMVGAARAGKRRRRLA